VRGRRVSALSAEASAWSNLGSARHAHPPSCPARRSAPPAARRYPAARLVRAGRVHRLPRRRRGRAQYVARDAAHVRRPTRTQPAHRTDPLPRPPARAPRRPGHRPAALRHRAANRSIRGCWPWDPRLRPDRPRPLPNNPRRPAFSHHRPDLHSVRRLLASSAPRLRRSSRRPSLRLPPDPYRSPWRTKSPRIGRPAASPGVTFRPPKDAPSHPGRCGRRAPVRLVLRARA
jgi:hypothetical protein